MTEMIVLISVIALGVGIAVYTQEDDSKTEEALESVVEDRLEELLQLDDDSLKDTIDFTPSTREED